VDNINLIISTETVEAKNKKSFIVFPNPASSQISIVGAILYKKIAIYNTFGELKFIKTATSDNENLDTTNFENRIYF